jgi:hypothetical protein
MAVPAPERSWYCSKTSSDRRPTNVRVPAGLGFLIPRRMNSFFLSCEAILVGKTVNSQLIEEMRRSRMLDEGK